jgi:nucleotide-binding universal stress UspA family protein
MQTIIVATDFSITADNAVRYVIDAAKTVPIKVVLFHLHEISSHTAHGLTNAKDIEAQLEKKKIQVNEYASILTQDNGIEIEAIVRMGDFLEEVEQLTKQYHSALLVLGMPKKSFEQDLLGNTTTAAIYKFKFPILAIPSSARYTGIRKILYACDLTRGIHAKVLEAVREYALIFGADVEVFYVGMAVEQIYQQTLFEKSFHDIAYTYKNVQSNSVVKAIQQEVEKIQADILIMTPNKYGFWSSLLHRSKTRAMASNGRIPLLSVAY